MFKRSHATAFSLIILIGIISWLYGQFLNNAIIFDDLPFFRAVNDGHQPVSNYHFNLFELRSLPYASLAWTKLLFGLDLINFRITNLILHLATVIALYLFLLCLFEEILDKGYDKKGLSPQLAAFFAAMLFGLHPVSTYAVGYLVQRTTVMATLFCLLAMLSYLKGSMLDKPLFLWLTVPLYYFAVFSKEHAIMLPAILVMMTILLHHDWLIRLKQRWKLLLTLAVISFLVILIKRKYLGSAYELYAQEMLPDQEIGYPLSVLTQMWLYFKYIFLWLAPNPRWMSIDMREPFASSLLSPYLLAAVCFMTWGGAAFWLLLQRRISGLAGFAMLFPWLMFMTELSSIHIQEVFVLYRSYLWAPGIFCLIPIIFMQVDRKTVVLVLSLIAVALIPLSMDRLVTLSHPVLLWDDAQRLLAGRTTLPGANRIYYNRGTEYLKIDVNDKAIDDLKTAVAINEKVANAHGNLAVAYLKIADWPNAASAFSRAIKINYDNRNGVNPRHIYGRAQAYENMGLLDRAKADYKVSCELVKRGCDKF
ncbi:MAG: hypothetical protein PHH58_08810 [Rhodoferax sp.]|nr:hypothetical protein [Rhodoferax sp.]